MAAQSKSGCQLSGDSVSTKPLPLPGVLMSEGLGTKTKAGEDFETLHSSLLELKTGFSNAWQRYIDVGCRIFSLQVYQVLVSGKVSDEVVIVFLDSFEPEDHDGGPSMVVHAAVRASNGPFKVFGMELTHWGRQGQS